MPPPLTQANCASCLAAPRTVRHPPRRAAANRTVRYQGRQAAAAHDVGKVGRGRRWSVGDVHRGRSKVLQNGSVMPLRSDFSRPFAAQTGSVRIGWFGGRKEKDWAITRDRLELPTFALLARRSNGELTGLYNLLHSEAQQFIYGSRDWGCETDLNSLLRRWRACASMKSRIICRGGDEARQNSQSGVGACGRTVGNDLIGPCDLARRRVHPAVIALRTLALEGATHRQCQQRRV